MAGSWYELTEITHGRDFSVTKVKIKDKDISIEGEFDLPALAKLSYEDQVFVAQFIRTHGSIKEMEQAFGISYPTVKARLNRLSEKLPLVQTTPQTPSSIKNDILKKLENNELTVKEALEQLRSNQ